MTWEETTMTNKNNITKMHYAQWLEGCLRDISAMPIRGIALMGVTDKGDTYVNYYECTMADKLIIAGLVNQDATLDLLAAQGVIQYEDEIEEGDGEEDDVDGEEEE